MMINLIGKKTGKFSEHPAWGPIHTIIKDKQFQTSNQEFANLLIDTGWAVIAEVEAISNDKQVNTDEVIEESTSTSQIYSYILYDHMKAVANAYPKKQANLYLEEIGLRFGIDINRKKQAEENVEIIFAHVTSIGFTSDIEETIKDVVNNGVL